MEKETKEFLQNNNESIRSKAIRLFFSHKGELEVVIARKNNDVVFATQEIFDNQLKDQGFQIDSIINGSEIMCIE